MEISGSQMVVNQLKTIKRIATLTVLVITVLFVSYIPYIISSWIAIDFDTPLDNYIADCSSLLILNNLCNIFIYAAKSRHFREALRQVFVRTNVVHVMN